MEFNKFCKKIIAETLPRIEGTYAKDKVAAVLYLIHVETSSVKSFTPNYLDNAFDLLKEWQVEAGYFLSQTKVNPFHDTKEYVFEMLRYGVEDIVDELLKGFGDNITFDKETKDKLGKDLEKLDTKDFVLYYP